MENKYKKCKITYSLILICLIVYLYSFIKYGETMSAWEAYELGAFNPLFVEWSREYWRFITSNFIHFGIIHLACNCYSLQGIGCFLEQTFKSKHYLIIIMSSAICTNLLGYIAFLINGYGANTMSGGISGVIFGLLGAIVVIAYQYKGIYERIYRSLLPNIILMFLISFLASGISLSGHIGGFIGGMLATALVVNHIEKNKKETLYHH
ncbi:MAG: rhomboid family intramembrane serine protease [Erysipelotrichaceae bacterium]|nr:rhomboid family intramembrane serine protease [Erysipelotrichaceae bacterium]